MHGMYERSACKHDMYERIWLNSLYVMSISFASQDI